MIPSLRDLPSTLRLHRVLPIVSIAVATGAIGAAVASPRLPGMDWFILAVFAVVIAVGEVNRIVLPGGRETAPMSLAEASKHFEAETARYRALAKAINLQPQ